MGTQSPGTIKKTDYLLMTSLIRLLERRSFKKISVNEICQEAMVSRSAFYQHFADKYELLSVCIETQLKLNKEQTKGMSAEQELRVMLEGVRKNQKLLKNLFRDDLNRELADMLSDSFQRAVKDWLKERQAAGMRTPEPVDMVTAFLAGGLAGMVISWIREDFRAPIEMMVACQRDLLMRMLESGQ